ncbi:uncharacterized protein LOC121378453 [Gigantopelta aegis]|uniref:uncharacterized protein LOC121378453 n=1 Tax=Gigantopelta aegis TaxID=1735272 RepID=UPI001B88D55C|nr:uncharacterized protein LOC121378453 [Gigantopelta aegis]
MPTTCAIVDCNSRCGKDNSRFYRLPKVLIHQGEDTKERSERRKRFWLAAINRQELTKKAVENCRVCSRHFISGKPSTLYDETNPDWVPSLNLGYKQCTSTDPGQRYSRLQNRKETKQTRAAALTLLDLNALFEEGGAVSSTDTKPEVDNETEDAHMSDPEKLRVATAEIVVLKEENEKLREEIKTLEKVVFKLKSHKPEDFENDDDKVKYYTGLSSFVTLFFLPCFIDLDFAAVRLT